MEREEEEEEDGRSLSTPLLWHAVNNTDTTLVPSLFMAVVATAWVARQSL